MNKLELEEEAKRIKQEIKEIKLEFKWNMNESGAYNIWEIGIKSNKAPTSSP